MYLSLILNLFSRFQYFFVFRKINLNFNVQLAFIIIFINFNKKYFVIMGNHLRFEGNFMAQYHLILIIIS